MGCAHNQQLDTAQPPGQIMKIIFAIRQKTKKHWNQNPVFSKLLYKLGPQWDISRATDGPFVKWINHQGTICKVPSLYTHTHLLSHWSNSSCCLSSASLYWEEASSTGKRGQVPALVGYSLLCLSCMPTQDTCSPSAPQAWSWSLVPFPLVDRRAKGAFSPSRKELQSKRITLTRKFRFGVTYLSLRCVRKDGQWGHLRIWK